jgi:glucose uptake protein GlcU
MITGTTWAVAFLCWLYANSILGEAFTFPILATAPSVLGCVIGIYFFKEVSDKAWSELSTDIFIKSMIRNQGRLFLTVLKKSIMLAVIGSLTCIAGVLCTSFSR